MKTLKNCIKLSCSIKIYVPSTVDVDKESDNSLYVDKTLSFLAENCGGSTSSKALGAWISSSGKLIKENVTVVFAYTDQNNLELIIDSVYDWCIKLKTELSQESIALEINNELYLI